MHRETEHRHGYKSPKSHGADTIRDQGILLELEFRITDPSATDTVLTFLAEEMFVDVVDENGSYSSGQFTLTKGVIHLK